MSENNSVSEINVDVSILLGETHIPVHQLLRMGRGAVIELDAHEDDDVVILANNIPVARGQVILRGELINVSITEMLMREVGWRPSKELQRITG